MWKAIRSSRTAVKRRTGMLTSPKLMVPDQMGLADKVAAMGTSMFRARQASLPLHCFFNDIGRGLVLPQPLKRGLLDHAPIGPAAELDLGDQIRIDTQRVALG